MRSLENLEQNAIKFWPAEIAGQEKDISIIPKLIETQDKFISLLNISDANPLRCELRVCKMWKTKKIMILLLIKNVIQKQGVNSDSRPVSV